MSVNKYILKTVIGLRGKLPGTRDSICELILSNKITIVRPTKQPKACNSEHCKLNKDQNKQIDSKSDTSDKEKVTSKPEDTNCQEYYILFLIR